LFFNHEKEKGKKKKKKKGKVNLGVEEARRPYGWGGGKEEKPNPWWKGEREDFRIARRDSCGAYGTKKKEGRLRPQKRIPL